MSDTTSSMQALVSSFERGEIDKEEYLEKRGELIEYRKKFFEKKHDREAERKNARKKQIHHRLVWGGVLLGLLIMCIGVIIIIDA